MDGRPKWEGVVPRFLNFGQLENSLLGFDAHHIIPWKSKNAKQLREFLLDNGFSLNEIKYGDFNGVWLPGSGRANGVNKGVKDEFWMRETWHKDSLRPSSKHSVQTMRAIERRLLPHQGNKQRIIEEIKQIGMEMQNGTWRNDK